MKPMAYQHSNSCHTCCIYVSLDSIQQIFSQYLVDLDQILLNIYWLEHNQFNHHSGTTANVQVLFTYFINYFITYFINYFFKTQISVLTVTAVAGFRQNNDHTSEADCSASAYLVQRSNTNLARLEVQYQNMQQRTILQSCRGNLYSQYTIATRCLYIGIHWESQFGTKFVLPNAMTKECNEKKP